MKEMLVAVVEASTVAGVIGLPMFLYLAMMGA